MSSFYCGCQFKRARPLYFVESLLGCAENCIKTLRFQQKQKSRILRPRNNPRLQKEDLWAVFRRNEKTGETY